MAQQLEKQLEQVQKGHERCAVRGSCNLECKYRNGIPSEEARSYGAGPVCQKSYDAWAGTED